MKKLISYADENRLVLLLEVGRFGHPVGPDNTYLVGFYERFGFVKDSKSANKRVLMYRSQVLHGL